MQNSKKQLIIAGVVMEVCVAFPANPGLIYCRMALGLSGLRIV
ncbi:hypothetical protein [Citrobacter youngae]|uniref:Uncharacterized protein n=1 Tax=Citrobacter youngae ATCC 29220 TaxID=500640 RepID=D4BBW8_9ENTR|nr:hypothetical protein [Citrobacter youngae]EFE08586.1 hypothetical protein CIT292_07908 [Citrobacter youngae ATCC 29220]